MHKFIVSSSPGHFSIVIAPARHSLALSTPDQEKCKHAHRPSPQ
jgi:hypothetical protein